MEIKCDEEGEEEEEVQQCAAVKKTTGSACTAVVTEHPVGRPIDRSGQTHHVGLVIGAPLVHDDGPCVPFALPRTVQQPLDSLHNGKPRVSLSKLPVRC